MISFCESVSLSREKFSDFDLLEPNTDLNKVFLAGYFIDEDGERQNIKIPAGYFANISEGDSSVNDLKPDSKTPLLTILDREYKDQPIKLIRFNFIPGTSFYQFNTIDEALYSTVNGNKYFCIKMPYQAPLGYEYKIYFANVPVNHGVLLFPSMNKQVQDDTPVELFMNPNSDVNNDYFVYLIQLIDPKGDGTTMVTKVLSVTTMELDEDETYLTFTSKP